MDSHQVTFSLVGPSGLAVSTDDYLVSIDGENFTPTSGAEWSHDDVDDAVPVWIRVPTANGCVLRGFVMIYEPGVQARTVTLNNTIGCIEIDFVRADGASVDGSNFLVSDLGHSTDPDMYQSGSNPRWLAQPIGDEVQSDWFFRVSNADCDLVGDATFGDAVNGRLTVTLEPAGVCETSVRLTYRDPSGASFWPGRIDLTTDGVNWTSFDDGYWKNTAIGPVTLTARFVDPHRCTWIGTAQIPDRNTQEATIEFRSTYTCIDFEFLRPDAVIRIPSDAAVLVSDTGASSDLSAYVDWSDPQWRARTIDQEVIEFHVRIPQPSGCDLVGGATWGPANVDLLLVEVSDDPTCAQGEYVVNFDFVGPDGASMTAESVFVASDNANFVSLAGGTWTTTVAGSQLPIFVRVPAGNRCILLGQTTLDTPGTNNVVLDLVAGYGCIEWDLVTESGASLGDSFRLTDGAPSTNIFDLYDSYWTSWRIRPLTAPTTFHLRTAADRQCEYIGTATVSPPGGAVTVVMTPDPTC